MKIIEYRLLTKIIFEKEEDFREHADNWEQETIPKDIVKNLISNLVTEIMDEIINNIDIVIGITTNK